MGGNGAGSRGAGVAGVMGSILVPEYTMMGPPFAHISSVAITRHTCNIHTQLLFYPLFCMDVKRRLSPF